VLFLKREVRFEVAVVIEFRLRFAVTISPPPVVVSFMVGLPVVPYSKNEIIISRTKPLLKLNIEFVFMKSFF